MLGLPCVMNYVYNNQLSALFILSLLNWHTSTCFGRSTAHHQELECVYVAVGTILHSIPFHSVPPRPADGQLRNIVPVATYTHYTSWWWAVDNPKHIEVHQFHKLRINSASSWLLYTFMLLCGYYTHVCYCVGIIHMYATVWLLYTFMLLCGNKTHVCYCVVIIHMYATVWLLYTCMLLCGYYTHVCYCLKCCVLGSNDCCSSETHSRIDLRGVEAIRSSSHVCSDGRFLDLPADGSPLQTI
jgi:hypothetical protein